MESKLRLKSATSHKAKLYGPVETEIVISGHIFKYKVYEAEIEENLLGYDFLEYFGAVIRTKEKILEFELGQTIRTPFKIGHAKNRGKFASGEVYYVIRAGTKTVLKPFVEKELATVLYTDCDCTEDLVKEFTGLSLESDSDFEMEWSDMEQDLSNPDTFSPQHLKVNRTTLSDTVDSQNPQVESLCGPQRNCDDLRELPVFAQNGTFNVHSHRLDNGKRNGYENGNCVGISQYFHRDFKPHEKVKLGVFANPLVTNNKVSKIPSSVAVQSGVVPCVTAPVNITVQNIGDECVVLPKYAVLGEVYLLHPAEYHNSVTKEQENNEETESDDEDDEFNMHINSVQHEVAQFEDAEYDPFPKDPIPENEPLPKDLQDLVNRSTRLSPSQKTKVENTLRKHNDVFAKDNTTFGKCPWLKFRIDTGDNPPIKMNARPVPIHYRKAVYETFMKYLQQGAIKPSQSAWASPILCVLKKTGEVRVCSDYRALNAITRVPATPIPRVQGTTTKSRREEIVSCF